MASLYEHEQGAYKNLDNALHTINRRMLAAAKAFGKNSEQYEHYQRELQAMFGKSNKSLLRVDPKTGVLQVTRRTKDIIAAGVSMYRVQHILDYMTKHSTKQEKKRITEHIKQKRKQAGQPAGKVTAADIQAEAQHLAESANTFEELLDYIYMHIDPRTMTGEAEALAAYEILTRQGDMRTYAELRQAAQHMIDMRDRLAAEGIPDAVPDSVQNLTSGDDLF